MHAILHIGTEKTGSTSIQSFLVLNKEKLLRHGIAVIESVGSPNNRYLATYSMDDARSDDSHVTLGIENIHERLKWKRKLQTELRAEIEVLKRKKVRQVILSCEHCHSRLVSKSEVESLKELLSPLFEEIKVLVYLRRQDEVAVSRYSTALKVGYTHKSIIPEDKIDDNYYDYEKLLNRWSDVFGKRNIIPRIFDRRRFADGDVIEDFRAVCSLREVQGLHSLAKENKSLSPLGQEYLRAFNKRVPGGAYGTPSKMRGPIVQYLEEKYAGIPRKPQRKNAEIFYALFQESNNRVAVQWFECDHLFDGDFMDYPEVEPDIDYGFEDAVNVSSYLWIRLMEEKRKIRLKKHIIRLIRKLDRQFSKRIRNIFMRPM